MHKIHKKVNKNKAKQEMEEKKMLINIHVSKCLVIGYDICNYLLTENI